VPHIKEIELGRLEGEVNRDKTSEIFYQEEKEELENEEVDKLILNSLCCEIMDEVMDLGNAYPQDCIVTPKHKPSSSGKKGRNLGVGQSKIVQDFWNSNGFKDPKKHKFISDLTKENNLNFIAISETRRSDFIPRFLKNLCGILLGVDLQMYDIGAIEERDFYVKFIFATNRIIINGH
jgi:hypothetical protein